MPDQVSLLNPDPPLGDDSVTLRPWLASDVACIEEAGRDPYVCEGFGVPCRPEEAQAWLVGEQRRVTSGDALSLAIADAVSGTAGGGIVLFVRPQRGNAGIGYWLARSARGRGLASRAVALLACWALTAGELARVEALVEPDNLSSQLVLERAGFEREGLLRSHRAFEDRRVDMLIYSLISSAWDSTREHP